MRKFLNQNFNNGNRFTNIIVSLIFLLLGVIGWFYAQSQDKRSAEINELKNEVKETKCLLYQIKEQVGINTNRLFIIEKNQNEIIIPHINNK
jgi:preprotein translocase subunit YajC